jgi:hypothetical protein
LKLPFDEGNIDLKAGGKPVKHPSDSRAVRCAEGRKIQQGTKSILCHTLQR